nr:MAG TPA: hypothetical protein [Caudoviricetes sp.]
MIFIIHLHLLSFQLIKLFVVHIYPVQSFS